MSKEEKFLTCDGNQAAAHIREHFFKFIQIKYKVNPQWWQFEYESCEKSNRNGNKPHYNRIQNKAEF